MKTSHFTIPLLKVTRTNYNLLIKGTRNRWSNEVKGYAGKVTGGILCKRLKLTDMYSDQDSSVRLRGHWKSHLYYHMKSLYKNMGYRTKERGSVSYKSTHRHNGLRLKNQMDLNGVQKNEAKIPKNTQSITNNWMANQSNPNKFFFQHPRHPSDLESWANWSQDVSLELRNFLSYHISSVDATVPNFWPKSWGMTTLEELLSSLNAFLPNPCILDPYPCFVQSSV